VVRTPSSARPGARPVLGRSVRRGWYQLRRRLHGSDLATAVLLCVGSVAIGLVQHTFSQVPLSLLLVPMVLADLVLSPRRLPATLLLTLAVMTAVVLASPTLIDGRRIGGVLVIFLVALILIGAALRRGPLEVGGLRGQSIFADLRGRIQQQARMPVLPEAWHAEAELRSAGGSSFAGDFLVASLSRDRRRLQVAVVDVSGKGEQAGARSLLLSGAFGGLLGALPPEQFLPAANDYLLRQDWAEGFATAVHAVVDLDTGAFELRSAGHPPGVQLHAGSGRWGVHDTEGPVLGLMDEAAFAVVSGVLDPGDTLLLFTDGVVETPHRDLAQGLDKLLGAGDQLLRTGIEDGARRLLDRLESPDDDRALLLLHRR
jgi:hypothetical protein